MRPRPNLLLDAAAVSRVIEMAWEDRTPFEAILAQFALTRRATVWPWPALSNEMS